MIGIIFHFGSEVVETRIEGVNILFRSASFGRGFTTIDNLYISKEGALKEFPDLENDEFWRMKAIQRFKDKIKSLGNEEKIADYLIQDLKKYGYVPKFKQKSGFRPQVINAD